MARRKKKVGRTPSPEGRVALNLTVPPYIAKRLKAAGNASAAVKALVDADIERVNKMSYPGPFWLSHRETGQYVIVNDSDYDYTSRKDDATEFGRYETAEKAFDKVGLSAKTHCIIPSRDID